MGRISIKKIGIAFAIVFLLSRSGKIMEYFSESQWGSWLTLEPLRNSPPLGRFIITALLLTLIYVTIVKILMKKK